MMDLAITRWIETHRLAGAVIILVVVFGVPALAYVLTAPSACRAMTDGTGLEVRWTVLHDCQVRAPGGPWIPANPYQQTPLS